MLKHKKASDILWGAVRKILSASYFFKNTRKLQKHSCFRRKTLNLVLNTTLLRFNDKICLSYRVRNSISWKMSNIAIFHISVARNIRFNTEKALRKTLEILEIANNVTFKGFKVSDGVKFFPQSLTKYVEINLINQGKTFIERLMADFVQFSNTITRFLFLEQRLGTRLCLSLILIFC